MERRFTDMLSVVAGCCSIAVAAGCEAGGGGGEASPAAALATAAQDAPAAAVVQPIEPGIPDTVLIDQDGKPRRFYTDLIKGKLVIVNALYTSCPATCPIQAGVFSAVEQRLGERAGKEVQLVSITLDPVVDTPERLRAFADQHRAGPGWVFLTGPQADVAHVLRAMDLYAANPADHTPIAAIGNEPAGVWMKTINLISPAEMMAKLEYVARLDAGRLGR